MWRHAHKDSTVSHISCIKNSSIQHGEISDTSVTLDTSCCSAATYRYINMPDDLHTQKIPSPQQYAQMRLYK